MKNSILALAVITAMSLLTVSCGSSKKVPVASYPEYTGTGNTGTRTVTKVKEEIDECEEQSMDAPASEMRAYASGISENRDFARQKAAAFARADIATQIESLALNVIKGYRGDTQLNGKKSNEEDIKQDIGSFTEQMIKGSKIICSNRYRLSDGTYECSVCVAVPSSEVETIVGAAALSNDERLGVEFDAERYRKAYAEKLEEFRRHQKEGR